MKIDRIIALACANDLLLAAFREQAGKEDATAAQLAETIHQSLNEMATEDAAEHAKVVIAVEAFAAAIGRAAVDDYLATISP